MRVELIMFKANGHRRSFPLIRPRTVLGRSKECHLQIPLLIVSRRHCELVLERDALKVRDIGSSNGTFVNEKRVQEFLLSAGDRLEIGPVIFTVVIDGKPEEIKPIRTVILDNAIEPVNQDSGSGSGAGTLDVDMSEAELAGPVGDGPSPPRG